jgi:phosphoglucomutase
MKKILDDAKKWLSSTFDAETRNEVQQLIDTNADDLADRFYKNMEFGTGGMRGIMGAGTNRINKYTLGKATQGLSNYLQQCFPNKQLKVSIAYDCRHNSKEFSKLVADVFSANNIQVYLLIRLVPAPIIPRIPPVPNSMFL